MTGPAPHRRRLRGIPVSFLVPNMITVLSLCAGMTAIRFALDGDWKFAAGAIALAAVLDTLDGRVARLLKASTKFGAELDSFADFLAFGVAPAMLAYLWAAQDVSLGWASALFFATCMALRLARFNIALDDDDSPPFAASYFKGTPAPAAAGIGLLPLLLSFEFADVAAVPAGLVAVWLVLTGLLMISPLPTYSFKRMTLRRRHALFILLAAVGVFVAAAAEPWLTLCGVIAVYLASVPLSVLSYRRQERAWRAGLDQAPFDRAPASDLRRVK